MPLEKVDPKGKQAKKHKADLGDKPKVAPKQAAPAQPTFAEQEKALTPAAAPKAGKVAMPDSTQELAGNPAFKVAGAHSLTGAAAIPENIAKLLLAGIAAEGVSDAKDLKAALQDYVDEATVTVQQLIANGSSLTWLKFYAGDTEVGYMFEGGSLKYLVSDGWIQAR